MGRESADLAQIIEMGLTPGDTGKFRRRMWPKTASEVRALKPENHDWLGAWTETNELIGQVCEGCFHRIHRLGAWAETRQFIG